MLCNALHIPLWDTCNKSCPRVCCPSTVPTSSLCFLIESKSTISDASLFWWINFKASIKLLQLAFGCLSSHKLNIFEQRSLHSDTSLFIVSNAGTSSFFSNCIPKSSHTCGPAPQTFSLTCMLMYFTSGRSSTAWRENIYINAGFIVLIWILTLLWYDRHLWMYSVVSVQKIRRFSSFSVENTPICKMRLSWKYCLSFILEPFSLVSIN